MSKEKGPPLKVAYKHCAVCGWFIHDGGSFMTELSIIEHGESRCPGELERLTYTLTDIQRDNK